MCIQDVKIGRAAGVIKTRVNLTTASQLVLNRNKNRIALLISPPATGFITISTDDIAISGGGIRLAAGANPLEMTIDRLGQAIQFPITMIHSAVGPELIEVWETTLNDGANIS